MIATETVGIVLAAGASSRMGRPKALLETPGGLPLALHQANLLATAGCTDIAIVVGDPAVAHALSDPRVVLHSGWRAGRVSSLQAGLTALRSFPHGVLVLPVDTVGISAEVLRHLLGAPAADAKRPVNGDRRGQVVWLSAATARDALALSPHPGLRLNYWLSPRTLEVPVDGPLGCNVNTPADWNAARALLHEELV